MNNYEEDWTAFVRNYSDLYDFNKEDIDMVMLPARHFIDQVKGLIDLP